MARKRPKYRNTPTTLDGLAFHSKREAKRYQALKLLEASGAIRHLELQTKYRIEVNGVLICTYTADFRYAEFNRKEQRWDLIVEDVKGFANDRWPMKKKLMRACHGIQVRET